MWKEKIQGKEKTQEKEKIQGKEKIHATGEGVVKYLFNVVVPFCFGTSTQLVMWRVQFEIIVFPFFRARVRFLST